MKILFTGLLAICISLAQTANAQVKIGTPAGAPNPAAVLELSDTARGFLLPGLTQAQMTAISSPPNGLLVFNTTNNGIYQYNLAAAQWRPIVADSSEWYFDPASAKLYLRRAINNQDSFYYNTATRKFMFADTRFYRTSTNFLFNLDEGNSDRFIFKTTASRFPRPPENLNSANVYAVYEVDNDPDALANPFFANYLGTAADVTVVPQATQKIGQLVGVRGQVSFGGTDSAGIAYGLQSLVNLRGKGHVDLVSGLSSSVSVRDSSTTIGIIYGIQNRISYSSPLGTPRVRDLFGYISTMSTAFNGKVDGSAYGIFLGGVTAAGPNRNYGIFTGKGPNRFGDSLLVTDGSFNRPRAVFDVNATSAMILPVGNTAQRPATLFPGMLRYNSDNALPEVYTATGWANLKNPVISSTAAIDLPSIANGITETINYTFAGAAPGNTVTVSPASALPNGIVIAWATVTALNQVTVGFANFSGAPVDLPLQSFYIKVIQ